MDIRGSKLRFDARDWQNGALTSVRLPAGSASGGLLVVEDDVLVFLLFADEDLEVGDEVVVPSDRRCTVTTVRHVTLDQRPVTALEARPRDADDWGDTVPARPA